MTFRNLIHLSAEIEKLTQLSQPGNGCILSINFYRDFTLENKSFEKSLTPSMNRTCIYVFMFCLLLWEFSSSNVMDVHFAEAKLKILLFFSRDSN